MKKNNNGKLLVKDFPQWKKIQFNGRTVLRCDTKYMSWEQIKSLDDLQVLEEQNKGTVLIVENK